MTLNILVVMDGAETVDPRTDTSFGLILAAQERGHRVWHTKANHLEMVDGRVLARARRMTAHPDGGTPLTLEATERRDVAEFDAVLIRTDPPFDADYLHLTLFLDHVTDRTLVVNAPRGLREANEKLYALNFPGLIPPTIVTSDADRILAFARAHDGAVLKPIDGHGGRGVMVVRPGDDNAASIIDTVTSRGSVAVMAQRWLENVRAGDKRILLLDGAPIGAVLRLPTENDFRANICVGGETVATDLDDADRRIIEAMAPRLRADGLLFVGIDVIDGHLTEVNVTSPTGIREVGRLSGTRPDLDVITWLERAVDQPPEQTP